MITKLKRRLTDRQHLLSLSLAVFMLQQFAQIPSLHFNHNLTNNLIQTTLSLLLFGTVITWTWTITRVNQELDTPQTLKNTWQHICWSLLTIILLMQIWGYLGTSLLHLHTGTPTLNQQAINQMGATWFSQLIKIIMVVFAAPMSEELLFRYGIIQPASYHSKSNRLLRAVISILIFASLHMLVQALMIKSNAQWHATIYGLIQYSIVATIFSYNYYRYNNIKETISLHVCYNALIIAFS